MDTVEMNTIEKTGGSRLDIENSITRELHNINVWLECLCKINANSNRAYSDYRSAIKFIARAKAEEK